MRENFKNKIRIFADSLEKRNFEVERFKGIISKFQDNSGEVEKVDSEDYVGQYFLN